MNFVILDNKNGHSYVSEGPSLNSTGATTGLTATQMLSPANSLANSLALPAAGLKYGFINNSVSSFIQALEGVSQVNVLASPRILVLNKQRAEIQLGNRYGYQTLVQTYTSTIQQVSFLNTGTLLRFRPFISHDGMIRMEVHPERSRGASPPTCRIAPRRR